jgi:hypothetical protein
MVMPDTAIDLEAVYERLAAAIDEAGPGKSEVFLAKVILSLAHTIGDPAPVAAAIEACLKDL